MKVFYYSAMASTTPVITTPYREQIHSKKVQMEAKAELR